MDYKPLERPRRICDQDWPQNTRPVVSIVCITYQHFDFIARAIEGFLNQETSFPVQILINDDASTDGTADIIRDYQSRYPQIIKATLQSDNQYSKGDKPARRLRESGDGEFIAYCEGDDFWTHPLKLEQQVNYLKSHPNVVLCFHDVYSVDSNGCRLNDSKIEALVGRGQALHLINYDAISTSLIPTLSIVFRNLPVIIGPRGRNITNGDAYLFAMLARYGEMHNIGTTMGAHRRHPGGIWTSLDALGQSLAHLKTLTAIAWEIDLGNCQTASRNLAEYAWMRFWHSVRLNRRLGSVTFARAYFVSFFCCLRCLRLSWRKVPSLIATEFWIMGIPLRFFAGAIRRNFKRRVCGQRTNCGH